MKKKAQMNQVFIYLFSIIIIVFAAFLVGKFVFTFSDDVESRADSQLYNTLKQDIQSVYRTYGSEKVFDYRVSQEIDLVCFVADSACVESISDLSENQRTKLLISAEAGDNVAVFDEKGILSSQNVGAFINKEEVCLCITPQNQRFSLVLENQRNEVVLSQN